MSGVGRVLFGALLALGLTFLLSTAPAAAAAGWWVAAPPGTPSISAVASNQGPITLAISDGVAGWYSPSTARFRPLQLPSGLEPKLGPALTVAAAGRVGVVGFRRGQLVEVSPGGTVLRLPPVTGLPHAVAVSGGDPALVAIATSRGLFSGRLGSSLSKITSGSALAVMAPPDSGRAWLALVSGRLWERRAGGRWLETRGAPTFGRTTTALAELSSGVVLVGEPGGLIWRGDGGSWARAFQVLPYGGLGGVPTVTSLVADGVMSAYLGTDGFGTLLTPDGGYTWYRAPPPDATIAQLATVGPVFSTHAHGLVVAVSSGGIYLHRLQALPQPPTYSPPSAGAELVGTAAVTVVSVLLITLLLWLMSRRQRRLSV